MQQLLTCKGFTPIGIHFDKFVMRDYDLKERNLEVLKMIEQEVFGPQIAYLGKTEFFLLGIIASPLDFYNLFI